MAALLSFPLAAAAQTPADIAHQLWPFGAPASESVAPVQPPTAGAFGASDLARMSGVATAPTGSVAPAQPASAGAFTGRDLARLSGFGSPALEADAPRTYAMSRPQ
jgi:hypothetical protein